MNLNFLTPIVDDPPFDVVVDWVNDQIVGRGTVIPTPFGHRLLCYADLTATGRHLQSVENYIQRLRSLYANSHTVVSSCGKAMMLAREHARQIIKTAVNADSNDVALFTGSGSTHAINTLVGILGIRIPSPLMSEYKIRDWLYEDERPIVFVGPFEHHSNELPWKESIADVIEIKLDSLGTIDINDLTHQLKKYKKRKLKIGSFSAASNVTGVIVDVYAIAKILHDHQALAFFDYACAGPYLPINLHPMRQRNDDDTVLQSPTLSSFNAPDPALRDCSYDIDAIFLSPHKFIGGPESSGVLIASKKLFQKNPVPHRPGGGTVSYVSEFSVDYTHILEEREEGGTPDIIGDIRAGIAFYLKIKFNSMHIKQHELQLSKLIYEKLSHIKNIKILGPIHPDVDRLAILPFDITDLHASLGCILLDHLFGLQVRGGCSCAGPYGHRLLGVPDHQSAVFRRLVHRGIQGMKPGWIRVTFSWYLPPSELSYILSCIELLALHWRTFLPLYEFQWTTGEWIFIGIDSDRNHHHAKNPSTSVSEESLLRRLRLDLDPSPGIDMAYSVNLTAQTTPTNRYEKNIDSHIYNSSSNDTSATNHNDNASPNPPVTPQCEWCFSASSCCDHHLSLPSLADTRATYLTEAKQYASLLERYWGECELDWNKKTGDADVDASRWFDYVYTSVPPDPIPVPITVSRYHCLDDTASQRRQRRLRGDGASCHNSCAIA